MTFQKFWQVEALGVGLGRILRQQKFGNGVHMHINTNTHTHTHTHTYAYMRADCGSMCVCERECTRE
jgi:hypothetical protein